jgi:hypothetical protein
MEKVKNFNETYSKIRFLIEYDSKKTLLEQTGPGITSFTNSDTTPKENNTSEDKKSEFYKEGCSAPEKAIKPPQTMAGEEGIIPGFCYYPVATWGDEKKVGSISGIYLPNDAKISFWDGIKTYNDGLEATFKSNSWKKLSATFDGVIENLTDTFPLGTVYSFKWGGSTYLPNVSYSPYKVTNGKFDRFYFTGFFNQDNVPYEPPTIGDDRKQYQKFIDEWGGILQWTTVIGTAVAGLFCEGCTLPLASELALEFGIGTAVGLREIEKGNDVSGVFSIITGLLPALKSFPAFRGIDPKWANSLSEKFAKSGLNSSSKFSQYVSFYNKLNKPEREIMAKMFRSGDYYTKKEILEVLSNEVKERLPNLLEKGFLEMWRKKPKLFKSIPVFERLWVRELSANLSVGTAAYLIDYNYPQLNSAQKEGLTEEMKDKLDSVYYVIPENTQKLLALNFLSNPEHAQEIMNDPEFKKSIEFGKNYVGKKGDNVSKGLISFFQNKITESVKKEGGEPVVFEESWFESDKMNEKQLSELKNMGYVEKDSVPFGTKYSDIKWINDIYWIKPTQKENKN